MYPNGEISFIILLTLVTINILQLKSVYAKGSGLIIVKKQFY
jgi:hypothetical protein